MNILILVCAVSISATDCQEATAEDVFYAPPNDGGMFDCTREGLMYAAQSNLVKAGTYAKIRCEMGDRLNKKAAAQ